MSRRGERKKRHHARKKNSLQLKSERKKSLRLERNGVDSISERGTIELETREKNLKFFKTRGHG